VTTSGLRLDEYVSQVAAERRSRWRIRPSSFDLKRLVEPTTRGDPMQPVLWTTRSLRNLSSALETKGHKVCPTVVGKLLRDMGYSLQANSKTRQGDQHIDRDAQFQYINTQAMAFLAANEPVISVDTKKKELVAAPIQSEPSAAARIALLSLSRPMRRSATNTWPPGVQ